MPGEKPVFNTARGAADTALLFLPPFSFPGVTARVFPLRTSMNLLRSFCRSYLNVAPAEICEFYPYVPYVLLVVLDYGRMAIEASNLGWVSQREVFFAVPLGKWRRDRSGRRSIPQGWVVNTPFIFVDNASSLTAGREAYGWPKVLAEFHPSLEHWLIDPRNPNRLLTLDVMGFGSDQKDHIRILEIDQQLKQNLSLLPPDFEIIDPLGRLSRLSRTSMQVGLDMAQLLLRSPFAGFSRQEPGQDPGSRLRLLFESLSQLSGFERNPEVRAVTLKQFRDSSDPTEVCYQALVQSRLGVARYNRGGLLGLPRVLQGDITGGFRIRLHDHPSFPIVESLGLEVIRERSADGRAVSILEPFFPFWLSVDLTYSRGETLCWRMRGERWHRKETPVGPLPPKAPFNTTAGAAQQVWQSPFFIPKASCYIFPLRVDRKKLCRFVDSYLNARDDLSKVHRFELCGKHVYMVARTGRIFSQARSAAWIEAHQVAFFVPLFWYERSSFKGIILATPFSFVDNPTLAMTMREVQGNPAVDATIEVPSRFWERKGRPLLEVQLDVFSTLDAGMGAERRTLLEVVHGALPPAPCPCPDCPPFELPDRPGGPMTLQRLTLKQFRDAEQPDRACFQSLIHEPWTLSDPKRVKRLNPKTEIYVYRYPSLPLVETLGLQCNSRIPPKEMDGAIADVLHPEDSFRIEVGIEIGLGEVLAHAGGSLHWMLPNIPAPLRHPTGERIETLLSHQLRVRPDLHTLPEVGTLPDLGTFLDVETLRCCGLQPLIRAFLDQRCGPAEPARGKEGGESVA
jgi:hypothetical protein